MNIFVTIVAVAIVMVGVVVSQINKTRVNIEAPQKLEVLSETDNETSVGSSEIQNDVEFEEEEEEELEEVKIPADTPIPTTASAFSLGSYAYPGATIVSQSTYSLTLESTDSDEAITEWYKEKIGKEGMNVKTFVTTKANDKVLNKLAGADAEREIYVEIKKELGENTVLITVNIEAS